jgi:glycerol-3-phosphate dehydrogenase (NAD(P)+)
VDTTRVVVLGAGSWGTVSSALLANNLRAGKVALWARDPIKAEAIERTRRNERYAGQLALPDTVVVTASLDEAVTGAGVIVLAVPSPWARQVLTDARPFAGNKAVLVSLTKGIEPATLLRMSEMAAEVLPGRPLAVLTGPNFAAEIGLGLPAATVVASEDDDLARSLQALFAFPRLRVYTNHDVTGCELAGSLKNVLALAAGMADGLGAGDNARAALMTRGLAELARLGVAMGGHPLTFSGLAGLGDLVLTCTSERSRNRRVGYLLGGGHSLTEILAGMHQVAEGVSTAASAVALGARHGVELPICEQVAAVLEGRSSASEVVEALLGREPRHELAGTPTWGPSRGSVAP